MRKACHSEERRIFASSATKIDGIAMRSYLGRFFVPQNDKMGRN
ncbi:hypothetical protein GKZ90_0004425 [Flavobacterium sp. MC2016-06]|nr:hypothetical protein [Flavobacterium sp. MC2016-06]